MTCVSLLTVIEAVTVVGRASPTSLSVCKKERSGYSQLARLWYDMHRAERAGDHLSSPLADAVTTSPP